MEDLAQLQCRPTIVSQAADAAARWEVSRLPLMQIAVQQVGPVGSTVPARGDQWNYGPSIEHMLCVFYYRQQTCAGLQQKELALSSSGLMVGRSTQTIKGGYQEYWRSTPYSE